MAASFTPEHLSRPTTISETLDLLKIHDSSARIVAGNTTLFELANQGALADVDRLIDISKLGLSYVRSLREGEEPSYISIGATTTFAQLAESIFLKRNSSLQGLKEVSEKITPPQIRNMGTVGGSICSGIAFYDMPVMLFALDAKVKVVSGSGERIIPIEEFFVDSFVTALSSQDLVTEIMVGMRERTGSSFVKLGRTSVDFAIVNSAVMITLDREFSKIQDARIVLGAVSSIPVRATQSEEMLIGHEASEEILVRAADAATVSLEPIPSFHASSNYKKKVIPYVVREALVTALSRAEKMRETRR